MIIVVAIVVIVLIAGFFILRPFQNSSQTEITPTPAEEPSPTEKPQIVKDKVRIQVVNGTGTPGQAGTAVEVLTKEGYNKDLIKTDNAEEYATTPTTITTRAGFEDVANDIKEILGEKFTDVTIESSQLSEDSEFDIVIVTGGEEYEEPTTAPTETNTNPSITPTGATTTPTPSPTP